eukprot:4334433-Pleurochrysis_carterae.AAC.3
MMTQFMALYLINCAAFDSISHNVRQLDAYMLLKSELLRIVLALENSYAQCRGIRFKVISGDKVPKAPCSLRWHWQSMLPPAVDAPNSFTGRAYTKCKVTASAYRS